MHRVGMFLTVIVALAFPATALAGQGHTPPGNSSVGQYVESVPGAGGNHPSSNTGGGGSSGGGGDSSSAIPSATSQALASQGSAGQATADLANATAPQQQGNGDGKGAGKSGRGGDGSSSSADSGSASSAGAGSGIKQVADELAGSGSDSGMGVLLPIILGLTALGALFLLVARWRRGSHQAG